MAINPICSKCGNGLLEFGALVFSPPNRENLSKKYHLCKNCYSTVTKSFK